MSTQDVTGILRGIAANLPEMDVLIARSRELIRIADEVGQDTTTLKTQLREHEIQLGRWRAMLKARSIT